MMDEEQSDGRVFFLDGRDGRVFLERKEWESFFMGEMGEYIHGEYQPVQAKVFCFRISHIFYSCGSGIMIL